MEKEKDFELRRYRPHIVVQIVVEGDFPEVGNKGFRGIFEYINGENRTKVPLKKTFKPPATSRKQPKNQESSGSFTLVDWGRWRIISPSIYGADKLWPKSFSRQASKRLC